MIDLQEQSHNGAHVIALNGEADLASEPVIRAAVRRCIDGDTPLLVVDFSGTTFVNTPVWALMVEYYQHTLKSGKAMALAGLNGRPLTSFETVRIGDFIDCYPTVDEAIRAKIS
ncbi:MAG: STAS domain-containing protein [Verrucomicrobiales bacterium]